MSDLAQQQHSGCKSEGRIAFTLKNKTALTSRKRSKLELALSPLFFAQAFSKGLMSPLWKRGLGGFFRQWKAILQVHRKIKWSNTTVLALLGIMVCLAIFSSFPAHAQATNHSSLKEQLAKIAGQIKTEQTKQDELLRKSKELTDGINAAKLKLQKGGNLLQELRLQNDLKASRERSDQIQELDKRIYGLTRRSVDLKKQLVSLLSKEIDTLIHESDETTNTNKRLQLLQRVLQIQKEKESYQAQIAEESNEILLSLEVTIADDDGPDDILLKTAIIEDQRDIMRAKIKKLDGQIRDIQKNINLQRNMLELLRDIGRGEEDELDLDRSLRIAERQEEIRDMESALKVMQARRDIWKTREKALTEKADQFYLEADKLLQPVPRRRLR